MFEKNKNIYISSWLLLITFLVGIMIIVGGLTRLTDSGLSITNWDLISGILPPLTLLEWEETFSLYKEIPEYKLINFTMTLNEFKTIYWWEYAHRLLGRIIGLFYLIPLLYFTFNNSIKRDELKNYYLILILIILQGVIGWVMVKSGLTDRTDVSHYLLSLHLTLAFIIFIFLLWNYFKKIYLKSLIQYKKIPYSLPLIFTIAILIQISIGALVSGLDAGQIYNTWPLMNETYFPDDSSFNDIFSTKVLEVPSIVQFIHRNAAYLIILLFIIIAIIVYLDNDFAYLRNSIILIFTILLFQTILGILTVISGAQIVLASLHQLGSIFLITSTIFLLYKNS